MALDRVVEQERKYDVDATAEVPALEGVAGIVRVGTPHTISLDAVYFDTSDLRLAASAITLRRRHGGSDAGWHLKLPVATDRKEEVRLPLGADRDRVPGPLHELVRSEARDHPLGPVTRIRNERVEHPLLGSDDVVLAVLCDDHVTTEQLGTERIRAQGSAGGGTPEPSQSWREWEVELVSGTPQLLDLLEPRLFRAGAIPARGASKLARALGSGARRPPLRGAPDRPNRSPAGDLALRYLFEHRSRLHDADRRMRAGDPEGVHDVRVATRRLRSALATYRKLFQPGSVDDLREELKWVGGQLGQARDAEVLRERLLTEAADAAPAHDGAVAIIDDELSATQRAGREAALAAVGTTRYFRLLDALDDLIVEPPSTPLADGRADKVVPHLLERDRARLARLARQARTATAADERDHALHEARKAAKRLRYAAESATPLAPRRGRRLARASMTLQDLLGEHQDSVVARLFLEQLAASGISVEAAFTLGQLHGLEQERAHNTERAFPGAWARVPRVHPKRWR
jgi:CHAD domain-containing protein